MNLQRLFILALIGLLAAILWTSCGSLQGNPNRPAADIVTPASTNANGEITPPSTNTVEFSSITTAVMAFLVKIGHPELAVGAGVAVPAALSIWWLWYSVRVRQLRGRTSSRKMGKLAPRRDKRTLKLSAVFDSILPPIPASFNFDDTHPKLMGKTPMFRNDEYGCCVIASRGHGTMRLEHVEAGGVLKIKDEEVISEYMKESGGEDGGLVMLTSLQAWRKGWVVGGKTYTIDAYGMLDPKRRDTIKAAMYLLNGIYCGAELPASAERQIGKVWKVVSRFNPNGARGTWGGHAMWLIGWNDIGPIAITWGKYQQMTWEFFERYFSEVYGVVDSIDSWNQKPGINPAKCKEYLNALQRAV